MRDDSGSSGFQLQRPEWRTLSFLASCKLHLASGIFENTNGEGELISTVCPKKKGLASWTDRI